MSSLDQVANFIKVTVNQGYGTTDTAIQLATGQGAKLPNPASGAYNLVYWNSTDYVDPADDPNVEIVLGLTAKMVNDISALVFGTPVENEVVSGSGTSWTLANTPIAGSVKVWGAGVRLTPSAWKYFESCTPATRQTATTSHTLTSSMRRPTPMALTKNLEISSTVPARPTPAAFSHTSSLVDG